MTPNDTWYLVNMGRCKAWSTWLCSPNGQALTIERRFAHRFLRAAEAVAFVATLPSTYMASVEEWTARRWYVEGLPL